jgi:hypothetical protein
MAGSRISYNIHAQAVKDTPRLKRHLAKIQPTVVLCLDGLGLAQELKAMLPDALVIHRNYGVTGKDDDVYKRVEPQAWLDKRAKETEGGIYLYTTNEPGFDDQCLNWHIQLMQLAAKKGVRLVIGNWAVGNPRPEDWPKARQMLELLDQHRDLFVLGLHEYGCGVLTSGFYGGYPDNAGVQPGKPGGQNLIPKDNWPQDVSKITKFHCGRFNFLINYCQQNGIKPPRIVLTEHGMDDVSDIKEWAKTLEVNKPYLNIRGWKTLQSQWNKWYNPDGWSAERAYFEQLAWADRVIYRNSAVEGQCIFSWGHTSDEWEQFDVADASELQSLLETYAQQATSQAAAPVVKQAIGLASAQTVAPASTQAVSAAALPVTATAAVVQPVAATAAVVQPVASNNVEHTIQLTLNDDDAKVITNGLLTLSKALSDPTVSAAFQRLADVLTKATK